MIEWSWRIESERSIVCGSWSDDELWEPTFARLIGKHVVDVATFGRLPEILISLSDSYYVTSFMTAEGDPEWTLFDRRGLVLIAVGCRSGTVFKERVKIRDRWEAELGVMAFGMPTLTSARMPPVVSAGMGAFYA